MASPLQNAALVVLGGPQPGADTGKSDFDTKARKQSQVIMRRFLHHRLAMGSLIVLLLLIILAFVVPIFWPYNYADTSSGGYLDPSSTHPLGTNQVGNDMLAQLMRGTQLSLQIAFVVAIISTFIGVMLGALGGYLRGAVDSLIGRAIDLFLIVPQVVLAAILVSGLGGSWYTVAFILAFTLWMSTARIIRGETLSLAAQEFIEAARAAGASTWRIITRHLIPNMIGSISVNATLTVALAVLVEAALSFIGLGVHIPDTSLGLVLNQNYAQVLERPWLFFGPFVVIVLISLTVNFIGDGMRDAFDPRQTKVRA
ncbi:MAG: ABC transporter permease [Sciscionella sp.]